jgi:hypothetical protein
VGQSCKRAWRARYPQEFLLGTPAYAYALTFHDAYKVRSPQFWMSAAITHVLAWLLLILASLILPKAWQDRPARRNVAAWGERLRHWRFGYGVARDRFRTRLLDINPFFWLTSRDQRKPLYVLALLALCVLAWLGLYWKFE